MQPLYPHAQLLQIKPKEKLSALQNELQGFQEFFGVDNLLQQAHSLLDEQDVQIVEMNKCIDEIKKFIELNIPIREKLNQVNYLIYHVDLYFNAEEAQPINNELSIQKKQLEEFKNNGFENSTNNENLFAELDQIFVNLIEELFKKVKETYTKRELSPCYEAYFQKQVGLIHTIDGDQKTKAHFLFQQLVWLVGFLNKFEASYLRFNELETKFKNYQNRYSELCKGLINSEIIQSEKDTIKQQIEILDKDFSDFDPSSNYHEQLNLGLIELEVKLDELYKINEVKLRNQQEQYVKLIDLLIDSKINLTMHAEKLKSSFLWAKSSKSKYQVIENIQQKIDALLKSQENQEQTSPNQESITELQQTINEAKAILSEYRGISLLRCFATLWGGGKVTSQLLVETLEEQLVDLQSNIDKLPLRI